MEQRDGEMIKNQWYGILDSKELKKKKLYGVTRMGEKLVLWRDENNDICCIADKCCHRGASLSIGSFADNGHNSIACPFHGFEYEKSGRVSRIPANGSNTPVPDRYRVNAYRAKEAYGFIWLWYGDYTKAELPEIPFFDELKEGYSYFGFHEHWPVHYTRAIENQLDVVHLPFVHANSIGRGNNKLVNGPVVKWEGNLMTFYVDNEVDDGKTVPLKPSEVEQKKNYRDLFHLQFQMPNLWQNIISDDMRIVAVFAPVDEENTCIYIRSYQRFANIPILRYFINRLSNIGNKYILHQDRRVVVTQRPVRSELSMGEKLIQGDLPIIEYRKRRNSLL